MQAKIMTQNEQILAYMREHGSITPLEALANFHCFRLSGRIFDLKEAGYKIKTEMVYRKDGSRYAKYSLEEEDV